MRGEIRGKTNLENPYWSGSIICLVFISMSFIGFDRLEAAIKQMLQYIPGFNYVIESDEDNVLVLKDKVFYEEDDFYVTITAAAKVGWKLKCES